MLKRRTPEEREADRVTFLRFAVAAEYAVPLAVLADLTTETEMRYAAAAALWQHRKSRREATDG